MPGPTSGAQRGTRGFGGKEGAAQPQGSQQRLACFFLLRRGQAPSKWVKMPCTASEASAA